MKYFVSELFSSVWLCHSSERLIKAEKLHTDAHGYTQKLQKRGYLCIFSSGLTQQNTNTTFPTENMFLLTLRAYQHFIPQHYENSFYTAGTSGSIVFILVTRGFIFQLPLNSDHHLFSILPSLKQP